MVPPLVWLILLLITLYTWVLIGAVIASWLVSFGVINMHNQLARSVVAFLYAVTDPVLRPIRRVIPPLGGLDISPIVALVGLQFLRYLIVYYL